jgi:hypothetical protein
LVVDTLLFVSRRAGVVVASLICVGLTHLASAVVHVDSVPASPTEVRVRIAR